MKSRGVLTFLTGVLILSAVSGMGSTSVLHVKILGEAEDIVTIQCEKISEDDFFITLKFADVDMALFEHYFAIARVYEVTDFCITGAGQNYYILRVRKECLKEVQNGYSLNLSRSALKETIDTTQITQYQGASLLEIRVHARNKHLRTFVANMDVDIASVNLDEGYMTVLGSYENLLALHLSGFETEVTDMSKPGKGEAEPFWLFPEYYTYPEVVSELSQIETDHPLIAEVFSLGLSYEGRDIPGLKISDNVGINEPEPEAFICAMHHAREAATVNVAMYIINYLTDNYGTDPDVTYLVDNREIYIVPIVNPDGKVYDDSGGGPGAGMFWRKNRQPCSGGIGIDLNRNYSYQWGGSGSSGSCTSEIFRGYSPFDAPESAAVRDFLLIHPDITVLLTYHSYGSLVLWPWGYTYDPIADPANRQVHELIGQEYASYTGYTPHQGSHLYLASGTTDDWSYGTTQDDDIPIFSWTIELEGSSFYPSVSLLPDMCAQNCEAALYVIECADNPYKVLQQINFSKISEFFNTYTFFVVGNNAYCTDVLGTGKIAFGLAESGTTENPEGRTHTILTEIEHSAGNLLIVGGPAINPVADEFNRLCGITYTHDPGVSFEIFCEGESLYLDLTQYPNEDICIIYVGMENLRNIMLVWGYGWRGSYAGSVLMGDTTTWQTYQEYHLLLLRWIDSNADGLVQITEITVEKYR